MIHRPPPEVDERIKLATDERPLLERENKGEGYTRADSVRYLYSEFRQRESITQELRYQEDENHGIYTGVGFGQWPQQVLAELAKNGRSRKDLSQFNFTFKKVNDIVGYLVRNWYDIDYVSIDGEADEALQYMRDLYFSDKDLCDWETEINDMLTNGCIRSGELLMTVDYRHDGKFGNIGVKSLPPGSVLRDVNWTTQNSGDCRSAFTVTYMTPKEIKERYKTKSDRIDTLIKIRAMQETDRNVYQGYSIPHFNLDEEYNKVYRVLEYHHMETETRKKRIGITAFGQFVDVPEEANDEWFEYNYVNPETVLEDEERVEVYYITTICPDLDPEEPFEDRKGLLQMGRLPLIHWSYGRQNGVDIGIVDLIKDPQRYYNQMMSLSHEIIAFARRVRVVDPGAFGNDTMNLDELKEKLNTPGETVFSEHGASLEYPNAIQEASPSTYTGNELNLAETARNTAEGLTPYNASMGGDASSGVRSAKHFDGQREQGEVNLSLLTSSVKRLNSELAECYYYASQSLYGGLYRKFYVEGKGSVEVNKPEADGSVSNDISRLPRSRVVITESPSGITRRLNNRTTAFETMQYMGNADPLVNNMMSEIIFKSFDHLTPEQDAEIEAQFAEQRELIRSNQRAQAAQAELMTEQSKMQIAQMQQQMQMGAQEMAMNAQEGASEGEEQEATQQQV
jgi:hypothetical protein